MNSPKKLLETLLLYCSENQIADLHLSNNKKPIIRNSSLDIEELDNIWDTKLDILNLEILKWLIIELAWETGFEKFKNNLDLDCSYSFKDIDRFRVNVYNDSNWYSIALRLIPTNIPDFEKLWLSHHIKNICWLSKWLFLITGPTWSGKSTTLASMLNYVNKNYKKHIITIEDPIEFSFKSEKSLINQREIWNHTFGFSTALKSCLREDPDVIMLWEMRDPETIKSAITLAETGHLVFSTLHTNDTVQSIDRIIDIFPSGQQEQVRMQLALSLAWVMTQRLLPRSDKEGRIAAREILLSNDAVRNLIISGQTHQLYSVLEVSTKSGMVLMDKYLTALYKKWFISKETLFSYARDKESIEMLNL